MQSGRVRLVISQAFEGLLNVTFSPDLTSCRGEAGSVEGLSYLAVGVTGGAASDQHDDDSLIKRGRVPMVVMEFGQRNLLRIESCDLKSGWFVLRLGEPKPQIITAL